jgi:hypothetical protein
VFLCRFFDTIRGEVTVQGGVRFLHGFRKPQPNSLYERDGHRTTDEFGDFLVLLSDLIPLISMYLTTTPYETALVFKLPRSLIRRFEAFWKVRHE